MSSPMSSEKGWGGTREESREAAGRLLKTTEAAAATTVVPTGVQVRQQDGGARPSRPAVPRAVATPKSPTRTGSPSTSKARSIRSRRVNSRTLNTTTPMAATGRAGERRTMMSTG